MKTVIIVSKCTKIDRLTAAESRFRFHFKGVCAGEALTCVELKGRKDFGIQKGEEYLMYVQLESCVRGTLKGTILRVRPLSECWDRS